MEIDDKIVDKLSSIGEQAMREENPPINRIYVDLEYLQDLRFGALLSLIKNDAEFKYVYSRFNEYNKRFDEEITKYFPLLGLTEDQIDQRLNDEKYVPAIASISPMTSAYYNFITMLILIKRHNNVYTNANKIEITLACHNKYYPKANIEQFCKTITDQTNGYVSSVSVKPEYFELYKQPPSYFLQFDMLLFYSMEKFINASEPISNSFVGLGSFVDKFIIAKPEIGKKYSNMPEKDKVKSIHQMRDQFNLFCRFDYMANELVINKK